MSRKRRRRRKKKKGFTPPTTIWEKKFARLLDDRGIEYVRQFEVERSRSRSFYVDFRIPLLRVFVEIDGEGHLKRPLYDKRRTKFILKGRPRWRMVRFWNWEVQTEQPRVRRFLEECVQTKKWREDERIMGLNWAGLLPPLNETDLC